MADNTKGAKRPIPDIHNETVLDGVLESFEENPEKYSFDLVMLYSDSNTRNLFIGREREVLELIQAFVQPSTLDQAGDLASLMSNLQQQVNGRQIVVGDKDKIRNAGTAVHGILDDFDKDPVAHVKYFREYFDAHPDLFQDPNVVEDVVEKLKGFLGSESDDADAREKARFLIQVFTGEEVPMVGKDKQEEKKDKPTDDKAADDKRKTDLAASNDRFRRKVEHTRSGIRTLRDKKNGGEHQAADKKPEATSATAAKISPPVKVIITSGQIVSGGISTGALESPITPFGAGSESHTRAEMPAIKDEDNRVREMAKISAKELKEIYEGTETPAQPVENNAGDEPEPQPEDSDTVNEEFEQWKAVIQTVCFNQVFPAVFEDTLHVILETLALPEFQTRFELCDYLYNALDQSSWSGILLIDYQGLSVRVKRECVIVEADNNTEVFDIRLFDVLQKGNDFSKEQYELVNSLYQALYKAVLVNYERVNGFFREFEQMKDFVFSNIPDEDALISGFWPTVFGKFIQTSAQLSDEQRESAAGKQYWERLAFMMEAVYGGWLGFPILESNQGRSVYFRPGIMNVVDTSGREKKIHTIDLDKNEGTEVAEQVLAAVSSEIIMKVPLTKADLMKILVESNDQNVVREALMKKIRDARA